MVKNPRNRRSRDPKSVEASQGKKGKIRYVLNGISENPTYPDFSGQKNSDFSGRMEVTISLFERVAPTPRNPYKTSAKPLPGESGRTPGTRSPFPEGKMWPDSPPTAYRDIYIYMWASPRILDAFGSLKPFYPLCLALKMAKNISPDSGEIFVGDGLPQYKNLVFFPCFSSIFEKKCLKQGI